MLSRFLLSSGRLGLALIVFAILASALFTRAPKNLSDFDQTFYLSIAYDLVHHGVFSNGVFDKVDSTQAAPPPGRFFGPVYPAFVALGMTLDARFARAVACTVEAHHKWRSRSECEPYARPMLIMNAIFLTLGVIAIALAAQAMLNNSSVAFWLAGSLATVALLTDVDLFSFVMTEGITFCIYSIAAFALVCSWQRPRIGNALFAGALFGALALTRASYAILVPVLLGLTLINAVRLRFDGRRTAAILVALVVGWTGLVGPWLARNAVSVGHWGLTEEYGSAALIERFAFNDMTAREFILAFPYCVPKIGEPLVDAAFGSAMERFVYHTPRSFFHAGRADRIRLVEQHGRLDPVIGEVAREEMQRNWWRHLLVSAPLGWCGMWVGGWLGLALAPLFAAALVIAARERMAVFPMYSVPPFVMLALHAVLANQYTRYNLILIGPFAVGAALVFTRLWTGKPQQERAGWTGAPSPKRR